MFEAINIFVLNCRLWSSDPRYILDLVKRVIRVSLETNKLTMFIEHGF